MENNRRNSGGKMSLMDIQAEQERERSAQGSSAHQRRSSGGMGSSRSSFTGGGGYGGGGSGGGYQHRSSSGGGRRGSHHSRRGSDRSSLPLERGCICSLKEKFGFIHCADRPAEIFFHYSEVSNVHPDHLQLDDEVEFRVGKSRDNPDKLAALEVVQLPTGTIEWEYEESPGERFQGLIDRPLLRNPGSNNPSMMRRNSSGSDRDNIDMNAEGLIRLLVLSPEKNSGEAEGGEDNESDGDDNSKDKDKDKDKSSAVPETTAPDTMTASDGPKIRFTANDYKPADGGGGDGSEGGNLSRRNSSSAIGNSSSRLYRGDLVEFTMVVEKRTRQKFARNIVLLQSERERARQAKEEQLLANACLERGVVVSLKQDFGFIRSNARRDEVYFHYTQVQLPEDDDKGKKDEEKGDDSGQEDYELKVGQEMEFLVVTEEMEDRNSNNSGRKVKTSARKVKFLPKGSVVFDKLIAEGVTGVVTIVPRADTGRNPQKERDPQSLGSIRLSSPIATEVPSSDRKVEAPKAVTVKTVLLHVDDAPGGLFAYSRGAAMGLWIREGDTLLFDVLYDFVDRAFYALPTKHLVPAGSPLAGETAAVSAVDEKENAATSNGTKKESETQPTNEGASNNNSEHDKGKKVQAKTSAPGRAVRLVRLSLAGRAEGTVHTIKEAYGFVHFAERPVDVHFKQFEVLPDELQNDLRRNMGLSLTVHTKADLMGPKLSQGTEVQFDLSVQGTVMTQNQHQNRGRKGGGANANQHERENLKAQRILILPRGTVLQSKTIGLGVKGVITKEDPNQPYAGILDLEEEFQQMSWRERHPLVVKMLDEFLHDKESESLVFHDIQSPKEEDVIAEILELKAKEVKEFLELSHIPQPGDSRYLGRLCIRKVAKKEEKEEATGDGTTKQGPGDVTALPVAAETEAQVETKDEKEGMDKEGTDKEEATQTKAIVRSKSPKGGRSKSPKGRAAKKKKALQQKIQPVKTIRYDKSSLTQNAKTDVPPGAGDLIICDVHQNRRTGKVILENLSVVERKVMGAEEAATLEGTTGVGVVKEVVLASKFGFISVQDETASKRELLFFHFASVVGQRQNQQQNYGRNKKGGTGSDAVIHKGDEVKFKIGTEKNGKRVAVDVQVISAGTIPSKVDKNACRGFILVEPTDTKVGSPIKKSRSFTRSREAPPNQNGGRWANVKEEDYQKDKLISKGEGVILLLEDPSGMFASVERKSPEGKEEDDKGDTPEKPNDAAGFLKCHLHYHNGAIALHGAGAPTTLDSSTNPRRGDLVSFVKSKSNASGVKDIRVITRANATLVRGRLLDIDHKKGTATFEVGDKTRKYEIDMGEVVSCDTSQLKNNVEVEGVLHGDEIHGVCRTTDLRLESKLGVGKKERPKLNLTVKKDRAGTIMAQSMMAKGPDGTTGFKKGWTTRVSQYAQASAN